MVETAAGQASGPSVFQLPGEFSLRIEPGEPLAGGDVSLTLDGLQPWQEVAVEFVDPRGEPAQWINENEVLIVGANDLPATRRVLYADEAGRLSWLRVGTQDLEGVWTVRIGIDGDTSSVTYSVSQLHLPDLEAETVGIDLRRYQGSVSTVYFSALVPAALTVDLQTHLAWVIDRLQEDLGIQSSQIPDVYLAGNRGLMQQIGQATEVEIGFEDGFYRRGGPRPGIYLRTDFFRSSVDGILTHEFIHLLLAEIADDRPLPAWLNEGLARFYEYEFGLRGNRPDAVRLFLYREADLAAAAALSDSLPSLIALESQANWNSQTDEDRIDLQYSEAYMAARFLIETHGADTAIEMVRRIGQGSTLAEAILELTGVQYRDFRQLFVEWLADWEDPERAGIREYVRLIDGIMDSMDSIFDRRSTDLRSGASLSSRVPVKRALAEDAAAQQTQAQNLSPPAAMDGLHQDALVYLDNVVHWLSLELEYAETRDRAKLIQANNMIPEVQTRELNVGSAIRSAQFVYNLPE